ncbi:MAG: hypothetical protein ACOC32_03050 [Nanoarchaeota archaeon]
MTTIDIETLAHDAHPIDGFIDDTVLRASSHFSKKTTKHDTFVEKLKSDIEDYYDKTVTHYTFFSRTKARKLVTKGEVDLLAFKGNTIHAFEVKCSNRITKAKQQLRKIKKSLLNEFSGFTEVKMFFYCGSSDNLQLIQE